MEISHYTVDEVFSETNDDTNVLSYLNNRRRDLFMKTCYDKIHDFVNDLRVKTKEYSFLIAEERTCRKNRSVLKSKEGVESANYLEADKSLDLIFKQRCQVGVEISGIMDNMEDYLDSLHFAVTWFKNSDYYKLMYRIDSDYEFTHHEEIWEDIKNIYKLDVIRRKSLENALPGGPKLMISSLASKYCSKCCERLQTNLSILRARECFFFSEFRKGYLQYTKSDEINKRTNDIRTFAEDGVPLKDLGDPNAVYLGLVTYLYGGYYSDRKNNANLLLDNEKIVYSHMRKRNFTNEEIADAFLNHSLSFIGLTKNEAKTIFQEFEKNFDADKDIEFSFDYKESNRSRGSHNQGKEME